MQKNQVTVEAYIRPTCTVIRMQQEHFLQTSVIPNAPGSEEPDYESDEDIDGGEYEFE